jgi:hypothetical protein
VSISTKPLVFISHMHQDAEVAMLIEQTVTNVLLGAIDVFNTSGRASLNPGDPWRDRIVDRLQNCVAALVVATPESVRSPWVNFESGGAWVSGKAVIPCCVKGMKKSSLPAPLSDLQALDLTDAEDWKSLIAFLAHRAGLASPTPDYGDLASKILGANGKTSASANENSAVVDWIDRAVRRPRKCKDQSSRGLFSVSRPGSVTPFEAEQFYGSGIAAGESVRCWIETPGQDRFLSYCFANGESADIIDDIKSAARISATIKCLGQLKVYETDIPFGEEDRGIGYHAAFLIEDVKLLDSFD